MAQAVGPAVARIGAAETSVATAYRADVEAKRTAEATGLPQLSDRAQAALAGVMAAKGADGRAEAWKALQGDKMVASEVKRFMGAAERRFGAEGVRAFDRFGAFEGAKFAPGERVALGEIGRHVRAAAEGGRAAQSLAHRLGVGARLKP